MATKAQVAANRRNARKSTGPWSVPGKDVTRLNGIKHGLRSREVVLPSEDPVAFQAHLDAWMDDWKPPTMARRQLVEDAAVAAWRKRRCVRAESTRISERIDAAIGRRHREEQEEIDAAVAAFHLRPQPTLAALLASRAGVDRLIAMWSTVAEGSRSADAWSDIDNHHFLMIALEGLCPGDDAAAELRDMSWRLYLRNAPEEMYHAATDPEPLGAEAEAVAALFLDRALGQIDSLRRMRRELPDEAELRMRRAEAEALEPRPEDAPLLRYEAQLSRQFHRSLADLVKLSETGADLAEAEAVAPTEANSAESVSGTGVEGDISGEADTDESALPVAGCPTEAPEWPAGDLGDWLRSLTAGIAGPDPGPDRS